VGPDARGEPIVFLQIDRQSRRRLPADLAQGLDFLVVVDGDAHHPGTGPAQLLALRDGGVDVARLGGAHALHHDRGTAADRRIADANRPGAARRGWCFHGTRR
jgi:hypothetical protein